MADTITLATLKTRARERADMENSEFVSDTELVSYINSSYSALYDLLVSRFEQYYTLKSEFTVAQGSNTQALPADFYKLEAVDFKIGSDWTTVTKWNLMDRNRRRQLLRLDYRNINPRQYRVVGNNIEFLPEDSADGDYRIWYTPRLTRLSADTDTIDAVNGWEEYIVVDAAIKMLNKEESDVSALLIEKRELEERIEAMAENRDGEPEIITDLMPRAWDNDIRRWDY